MDNTLSNGRHAPTPFTRPRPPHRPDELVAVKSVDATRFRSIAEIEQIQEEMAVLSSLRHPNIIRLLDVHFQVRGRGRGTQGASVPWCFVWLSMKT